MSQDDNRTTIEQGTPQGALALPDRTLPQRVYLIPVRERPFMPGLVQPLLLDAEQWRATLERVGQTPHHALGLVYVGDRDPDEVDPDQFPQYGCLVKIHAVNGEENQLQVVAQGLARFRVEGYMSRKRPFMAEVSYPEPRDQLDDSLRAYAMAIINTIKELLPLNPLYNEGLKHYLQNFSARDPSPLTDFAASLTSASGDELQEILETVPLRPRMERVLTLVKKEVEVARLQNQLREEVNEKISKHQREFFLKEQLKVIQRELGLEKDDRTADADEFRERMEALSPPEAVQKRFEEELRKFGVLESGSPEYAVTRNYLDWLTSVPWGTYSDDNLDLDHARDTLEAHHSGLTDVKDRIIEFLAVGAMRGEMKGSILLLVGPPGVGKTSIGRSIAEALDRRFYRLSLGGMRDEAEIKGHRRTYIGALPGKLTQALKDAGTANPVIMLDEIDKLGQSFQGDPASALLEVLDPEQNQDFLDHYLDQRLDLSHCLFVCTANTLDSIPGPLLDRMEVIRLSGYITEEKVAIARNHLWPRALERAGVKPAQLKISDSALKEIAEGYAREAGVRNLEKQLNKIIRKAAVRLLSGEKKLSVTGKNLEDFLGQPYFQKEKTQRGVGVVTGLAWTAMGGATLSIEASQVHAQRRGFKQTGQLGDVMKESAEIAYSYVASHLPEYGGSADWFDESFVHLHVPEGATPKDGPSAGVTMATALISLATGKRLPRKLAMTGELTLTGQVLAVGGIREKVIAARRVGIREVILPKACERDYKELPDYLKKDMTVHFAERYQDVHEIVWANNRDPAVRPRRPTRAEQPDRYIVPECREPVTELYRDAHILVVNKPPFLLSVPGRAPENRDCVTARLKRRDPDLRLVHRLDLDTSGVMVFALTRDAQSALSRAFQQRRVAKAYQAVVDGLVREDEGEIDLPLCPDWPNRPLQKVCLESGKTALTRWRVLRRDASRNRTRLRLEPVTGRSHQLRIHCREIGHPILGCDLYAPPAVLGLSDRLLLHAETLAFNHPVTGLWNRFHSPVPF